MTFNNFPIPTKAGFEALLVEKAQDVATDADAAAASATAASLSEQQAQTAAILAGAPIAPSFPTDDTETAALPSPFLFIGPEGVQSWTHSDTLASLAQGPYVSRVRFDTTAQLFAYDGPLLPPGGYVGTDEGNQLFQVVTPQNILTETIDFADSIWTKTNVTLTAGQTAPDASTDAFLMVPTDAGPTQTRIFSEVYSHPGSATSEIYVKSDGWRWVYLHPGTNEGVYFDVIDGVVGQQSSGFVGSISDEGDGWYKISVRNTNGSTRRFRLALVDSDGGANTATKSGDDGIIIWRAQVLEGPFAHSLILPNGDWIVPEKVKGWLDIRSMGVHPHPTTDQSDAIHRAKEIAREQRASLFAPAGVYRFDPAKTVLEVNDGCWLRGAGRDDTIFRLVDGIDATASQQVARVRAFQVGVQMSDFTLDGNSQNAIGTPGANQEGLDFDGNYCAVERVTIKNIVSDGIDVDRSIGSTIRDIKMENIGRTALRMSSKGNQDRIKGVLIENVDIDGFGEFNQQGVLFTCGSVTIRGLRLRDYRFPGSAGQAIVWDEAMGHHDVQGLEVYEANGDTLRVEPSCTKAGVIASGIDPEDAEDFSLHIDGLRTHTEGYEHGIVNINNPHVKITNFTCTLGGISTSGVISARGNVKLSNGTAENFTGRACLLSTSFDAEISMSNVDLINHSPLLPALNTGRARFKATGCYIGAADRDEDTAESADLRGSYSQFIGCEFGGPVRVRAESSSDPAPIGMSFIGGTMTANMIFSSGASAEDQHKIDVWFRNAEGA